MCSRYPNKFGIQKEEPESVYHERHTQRQWRSVAVADFRREERRNDIHAFDPMTRMNAHRLNSIFEKTLPWNLPTVFEMKGHVD